MQGWEYCLLVYYDLNSENSFIRYYQASGGTTEYLQKDAVAAKLAELGRQGWELVSVLPGGNYNTNFYFKRPLP